MPGLETPRFQTGMRVSVASGQSYLFVYDCPIYQVSLANYRCLIPQCENKNATYLNNNNAAHLNLTINTLDEKVFF